MKNINKLNVLFCLFTSLFFAQEEVKNVDNKFLIGLHYISNSSNNNVLSESYNGIAGLDAKYKFASSGIATFDAGMSFDYLDGNGGDNFGLTYNSMTVLNPNVGIELDVLKSGFRPFVNLGYAFVNYSYTIKFNSLTNFDPAFYNSNSERKVKYNENGFTIQPGFRYHFKKLIYLETSYKYLPINTNVNLHFFNLGLGIKL